MKIACDKTNGCEYFTEGKRYTVMETVHQDNGNRCYKILNDDGLVTYVVACGCPHIQANWYVVEFDMNEIPTTDEEEEEWVRMEENQYSKYFKDFSHVDEADVYQVHHAFNIEDPSGCIHHASKKLLLSGVRTGGKSKFKDVEEARDTLNRWLEINSGMGE